MAHICDKLAAINKSSFTNESDRLSALHEARALCRRLERTHETLETLIWTNPFTLLSMKVAADMGVFQALGGDAKSSQQLAAQSGAEPMLVRRIMRMLTSVGVVLEPTHDSYTHGELSSAFQEDPGLVSGLEYFYAIGVSELKDIPDYLRHSGYRNPANIEHTPFSHSSKSPSFWSYMHDHPKTHAHFNAYLASIRKGQAPWTSIYPINRLIHGFDHSSMLCVDVGGGIGKDVTYLSHALPSSLSSCSIILQDLSSVISQSEHEQLPSNVVTMSHDFFTSQPVLGARVYFMHSIAHDWPDREAKLILSKIRDAMQPGYSRLLLYETVMPADPAKVTPRMAAMDLNMMSHFAALERTEAEWRSLLADVGMQWTAYFSQPGAHQGIIEAELI